MESRCCEEESQIKDSSSKAAKRHVPRCPVLGQGVSQNHCMVGVGRDLCGSPSPTLLPKQGHLQQAAQDLVRAGLEYLQRRRLHNLPGQPVPGLRHPQSEEVLWCCWSCPKGRFTGRMVWMASSPGQQEKSLEPCPIRERGYPVRA